MNTPLVPRKRLVEIMRGFIADRSDKLTRPDMNNENHLVELMEVVVCECEARLPLWKLETKNDH